MGGGEAQSRFVPLGRSTLERKSLMFPKLLKLNALAMCGARSLAR